MTVPVPRTIIHTHGDGCLVYSPAGSFVCTVTLLPLSVTRSSHENLAPDVYQQMADLALLTPQERAEDYDARYKAAVEAAHG